MELIAIRIDLPALKPYLSGFETAQYTECPEWCRDSLQK